MVRRQATYGFTLIELSVTIVIAAVIGGLGAGIIVQAGRAYSTSRQLSENCADADYALRRFATEFENVASTADITAVSASSITFRVDGVSRTFAKSGTNLLRDAKALASDVSGFTVTCYDANGAVTTQPSQVRRVAAELQLARNGLPVSVRTEVFPRALRTSYASWREP